MKVAPWLTLALALTLTGCATRGAPAPGGQGSSVPWPVGMWEITGRASFSNPYVSSAENRTYHAVLQVTSDNVLHLVEAGTGSCGDPRSPSGSSATFHCGDATFDFRTDGQAIRGTLTKTAEYSRPTTERRCAEYGTDAKGSRRCLLWERVERTSRETSETALRVARQTGEQQ